MGREHLFAWLLSVRHTPCDFEAEITIAFFFFSLLMSNTDLKLLDLMCKYVNENGLGYFHFLSVIFFSQLSKFERSCGVLVWWLMPLIAALGRQKQVYLYEFEGILVYIVSSRTVRTR